MVLRLRVEVANRRARKALAVYVDVGRDCAHPLVFRAPSLLLVETLRLVKVAVILLIQPLRLLQIFRRRW